MGIRSRASIAILLIAAFVAGVFSATMGANWLGAEERVGTPAMASSAPSVSVPMEESALTPFEETFVSVAERINRTVVQIRSERVVRQQAQNPFEGTPFGEFFGQPDRGREVPSEALGSGVIIDQAGYIITNNHVISGAEELEVVLFDGSYYDAEVIGADAESDLAVIRIKADDLEAAPLGNVDSIHLGQWVLAFGSPLSQDLGNTITSGIVSAVGRTSTNLSQLNLFASFIQTDAAINPGNSGGPLVDLRGNVIGINSAIYSRSGGNQGIGFAIPVDVVQNVAEQLIDGGEVERGFLGVEFGNVSTSLADLLGVPRGSAQIARITDDSPAERAGIEEGDVIVAVNGQPLRNANQLRTTIGNLKPGASVGLEIVRGDSRRNVDLKLGRRADFTSVGAEENAPSEEHQDEMEALGLTVGDATPALAQRFGIDPSEKGVLIVSVDRTSAAYRDAELRPGDLITEIDRKPVESEADFRRVFGSLESGEPFMVKVLRFEGGTARSVFTALTKP